MSLTTQYLPKPITIISGFLGAGKTTFLNEYIAYNKTSKPVIIENEFGKEGIDGGLIIAPDSAIFELNSGCLCCNLNEDLFDLLESLWERKETFDELIIEATGIADPAAIAQPFIQTQNLERYYKLERVICLVDAQLIEFELEETEEARKQIAFADIILINKSDSVRSEYIQELIKLLTGINPFARVFFGNKDDGYPMEDILKLTRNDFDQHYSLNNLINNVHSTEIKKDIHHHNNITSLSFVHEEPFDVSEFQHRLLVLLNFQAKDIYRVKGCIYEYGNKNKIIVQSVSNILAITEGENWQDEEIPKSKIVFSRPLKTT